MIGRETSSKPSLSSRAAKRASIRLRRAASSTSSGRTPVGYRNLLAINQKPLPALREGVQLMALVSVSLRPLSSAGRVGEAPLDHRMMMVVVPAGAGNVHVVKYQPSASYNEFRG